MRLRIWIKRPAGCKAFWSAERPFWWAIWCTRGGCGGGGGGCEWVRKWNICSIQFLREVVRVGLWHIVWQCNVFILTIVDGIKPIQYLCSRLYVEFASLLSSAPTNVCIHYYYYYYYCCYYYYYL